MSNNNVSCSKVTTYKIINSVLNISDAYKILQFRCPFDKILMRRTLVKTVGTFVKEFQFKAGIWQRIAVQQNNWWREQWDKLKKQYDVTVQKLSKEVITFKIRQKLELGVRGWSQALNPSYPMTPEERTRYRGYFLNSNQPKTNVAAMHEILELLLSLARGLEKQYAKFSQAHQRYCVQYRQRVKPTDNPGENKEDKKDVHKNGENEENEEEEEDEDDEFGLGLFGKPKRAKQPEQPRAADTQETKSKKRGRQKKEKRMKKETRIKKERKVNKTDQKWKKFLRFKKKTRKENSPNQGQYREYEDNYDQQYLLQSGKEASAFHLSQISSDSVSSSSSQESQIESGDEDSVLKPRIKQKPKKHRLQIYQPPSQKHCQKYF